MMKLTAGGAGKTERSPRRLDGASDGMSSHVVMGSSILALVDESAVLPALCKSVSLLSARLRRALVEQSADRASRSQPWACLQCTFCNPDAHLACGVCYQQRPSD